VWRRANARVSTTETTTNQTDLFGEFRALGFKNNYSTGVEFTREESKVSGYVFSNPANSNPGATSPGGTGCQPGETNGGTCTSLSNPNPDDAYTGTITRSHASDVDTVANTRSIYAFDTIELDPQWLLNLGGRYDSFRTTADAVATGRTTNDSNFWNWQAGLVFKPTDNGSIYASYATSATPPGSMLNEGVDGNPLTANGSVLQSDLQPETTKNYELGTKWDVFQERVSLTAALFRTEKENTRVLTGTNTYENAGKTRVDGVELSASGKITEKWQVFAGYSYLDSEILSGGLAGRNGAITGGATSDGKELPNTPKHSASLWTTYQVAPKLTIGGGAFYVGEVWGDTANTVYVPSYTRYDAMAAYKLSKNVDFQLNVQNLTDKVYYDKAYAAHFANQAAGRTVLFSTNFHF